MLSRTSRHGVPFRTTLFVTCLAFALTACSSSNDSAASDSNAPQDASASATNSSSGTPLPSDFTGTAWRVDGTDGARYTTYLDPEGRYRDWRDGQPWATGTWENGDDGSLCFTPDGDNVLRRCWQPNSMTADGTMTATAEDGHQIELTQVDYSPPPPSASSTASKSSQKKT